MNFAKVYSGQVHLVEGRIVDVEVDLSRGLHAFSIVGLPDKAVEESRDRISAAIKNSGFESPKHKNQKVVISLAPAHLRKEGPVFDLAMALGYLLASGDIRFDPEGKIFLGELSLDGELRGTTGILPIVIEARKKGFKEIFLPHSRVGEAELVRDVEIFGAKSLNEVVDHLNTKRSQRRGMRRLTAASSEGFKSRRSSSGPTVSFDEIRGQGLAKRGLEVAAAGGHNVVMYGPPGTGKTMLARAFESLLPDLSFERALEVTALHSIAGHVAENIISRPPLRAPHHTSSHTSLIGGGSMPRPGEVTLAHQGVLFLDEFPEFERRVLEALRQPLEEKVVTIGRARGSALLPANIILVATMNPCPCGYFGSSQKQCACSASDIFRYRRKVSGPIADRIDLWIEVGSIEYSRLEKSSLFGESVADDGFSHVEIRERVKRAREVQIERFKRSGRKKYETNSDMSGKDLETLVPLSHEARSTLVGAAKSMGLSMRAFHRVWKISKTIADLSDESEVLRPHILEALQYRSPKDMDRS